MELHMQSTIIGQMVRWVSRNGMLKYPDEIDPSLWESAVRRTPSQGSQQSPGQQSQEPERPNGHIGTSENGTQDGEALSGDVEKDGQANPPRDGPSDVLVVGWYGPDDPETSAHCSASGYLYDTQFHARC